MPVPISTRRKRKRVSALSLPDITTTMRLSKQHEASTKISLAELRRVSELAAACGRLQLPAPLGAMLHSLLLKVCVIELYQTLTVYNSMRWHCRVSQGIGPGWSIGCDIVSRRPFRGPTRLPIKCDPSALLQL